MAENDEWPQCGGCGGRTLVGMRLPNGKNVPMCATCQKNLAEAHRIEAEAHRIEQEARMRYSNFLMDDMEARIGVRGVGARFELPAVSPVNNHIRIENSQIGIVNTGVIHRIESAIGALQSTGDGQLAIAFKQVTEAVSNAPDVDQAKKAEILEQLSALSEEAAKPKAERRLGLVRGILETVKTGVEAINSVSPLLVSAWPHIVAALT